MSYALIIDNEVIINPTVEPLQDIVLSEWEEVYLIYFNCYTHSGYPLKEAFSMGKMTADEVIAERIKITKALELNI